MELVCARCGAPLPTKAADVPVACVYCGTTSTPPPKVVAVGRLRPMAAPSGAGDARVPCPRCADFLDEIRVGASTLSACESCGGAWVGAATVARLKHGRDAEIEAAAGRLRQRLYLAPDRQVPIACPVCREHLRRVGIPGEREAVDVCDAHGTWFDGGDAKELQAFIAAFERLRDEGKGTSADDLPAGMPRGLFAKLFGGRRGAE